MKKLLFITWSISYGYGTEKSLADVLNRMVCEEYEIHILPLFKNSDNMIFDKNIKQLVPFLKDMENLRNIRDYNNINVIMHYEPEKGHDGISMEAAIKFLYSVLDGGFVYG
jgi:hypothetical protein